MVADTIQVMPSEMRQMLGQKMLVHTGLAIVLPK